jgi:hypothetical protein
MSKKKLTEEELSQQVVADKLRGLNPQDAVIFRFIQEEMEDILKREGYNKDENL